MVAFLINAATTALTNPQAIAVAAPVLPHADITLDILVATLGGALGIIGFLTWNIYAGVRKTLTSLQNALTSCRASSVEYRSALPGLYADREETKESIDRIYERQDKLRENLPIHYMTRIETMQIVDTLKNQIGQTRNEIITLLNQIIDKGNSQRYD